MISKNNVLHKTWFKLLNLKKKAIHSSIPNLMKMWFNVLSTIVAMKEMKNKKNLLYSN
jgi:hypothetical protein